MKRFAPYLGLFHADSIEKGGGGTDIAPLRPQGAITIGYRPVVSALLRLPPFLPRSNRRGQYRRAARRSRGHDDARLSAGRKGPVENGYRKRAIPVSLGSFWPFWADSESRLWPSWPKGDTASLRQSGNSLESSSRRPRFMKSWTASAVGIRSAEHRAFCSESSTRLSKPPQNGDPAVPPTILIVEDDEVLGQVLAKVLTCEGQIAVHVRTAGDALSRVQETGPTSSSSTRDCETGPH